MVLQGEKVVSGCVLAPVLPSQLLIGSLSTSELCAGAARALLEPVALCVTLPALQSCLCSQT